jgi:hypothetical protein
MIREKLHLVRVCIKENCATLFDTESTWIHPTQLLGKLNAVLQRLPLEDLYLISLSAPGFVTLTATRDMCWLAQRKPFSVPFYVWKNIAQHSTAWICGTSYESRIYYVRDANKQPCLALQGDPKSTVIHNLHEFCYIPL